MRTLARIRLAREPLTGIATCPKRLESRRTLEPLRLRDET
jgi:hypothetical protein